MFRENIVVVAPKKDDVAINMVLAITTHNEIPKNVVFKKKKPNENNSLAKSQAEEKLQWSFEEATKDIQQKELLGANTQTPIKANFTKNFGLDTKDQFFGPTRPTNFTGSTKSTNATNFVKSTRVKGIIGSLKNTNVIRFIGNIGTTNFFLVLDDIIEQLLESKHTLTLGQLFKITLDLKQYVVAKLAPRIKTITSSIPNLVITLVVIYPHMVVI